MTDHENSEPYFPEREEVDDLESLVRHAALVIYDGDMTLTVSWRAKAAESHRGWRRWIDNWIREHVEGWLLEQGLCHYIALGEHTWVTLDRRCIAHHKSRTTAALKALKEATK